MKTISAVIAIGLLSTSSVIAETKTETPIVVTASRTAESVDETLATVSVITRNDIEASQARELVDLLKLEAGIDLSKNGGPGSTTNIFTRGTNSNHTLIMIDGMRVASSATGTFALERLSLNEIERIEIVRGPRSTQYGSDAIGGIIQIITRKNNTQYASVGFGSFNTRQASAGYFTGDKIKFNINASYEHADGFSATNTGNFSYDPDNDGYRKNNANIGIDIPLAKDANIHIKSLFTNSWTEFDQGTTNTEGGDLVVDLNQSLTDNWSHKLLLGYNEEEVDTSSANPSIITTNRIMLDWQNDIILSDNLLLLVGFTRYEDEARNYDVDDTLVTFDNDIDNNAVFANFNIAANTHDFLVSLRYDDHSNFGSHNSGLISWGYDAAPNLRVTATVSNAFRAPTINELYHPGFGGFYAGNPNLKPEESDGGEISARFKFSDGHNIQVTYFKNWIKNLIAYSGGATFEAENVDRARTQGYEIMHQWQQGKWSTNTNATLQRAYDDSTNQDLLRRPRKKFSLVLKHQHTKNSSSRFEILAVSSRSDFGGVNLPGYTIFNFGTRVKIDKQLWFTGRMDNITNKQYELAENYNTANRSIFIGLSYELNK